MIVPVLFLLLALTTAAGSLLTTDFLHAKAAQDLKIARAAELAVSLGELDLLKSLQTTMLGNMNAGQLAAGGVDGTYVRQTPLTQEPATNLYYATYEQINGATNATGAATDTAQNLQTSAIAQEQRFSAVVSAEIHGAPPASPLLGRRTRLVTVRIFSTPPYAVIDGARDVATAGDVLAAQGDPAGVTAQPGDLATPAAAAPDSYHDTTIKVRYGCAGPDTGQTASGNDGQPWGAAANGAISAPCNPTPPPWASGPAPATEGLGDLFTPKPWANGDTNQTNFSR